MKATTVVFAALICTLAGCGTVIRETTTPRSEVGGKPCRPFAVDVIVPRWAPDAELRKAGTQMITEGCPVFFSVYFEDGAIDGDVWITFEPNSADATPFVRRPGQGVRDAGVPVTRFRVSEAPTLRARRLNENVCRPPDGCKYTITHVARDGTTPYPPYDPRVIIVF